MMTENAWVGAVPWGYGESGMLMLCPYCEQPMEDGYMLKPMTDDSYDRMTEILGPLFEGECHVKLYGENTVIALPGGRWYCCENCIDTLTEKGLRIDFYTAEEVFRIQSREARWHERQGRG